MRLSSILLGCALLVLSVHTTDSAFVYPDCNAKPLQGTPICDPSLPYLTRARYIVSQMNVSEKVSRLTNTSPGIARLNLPAYQWWSEALHGVAYSPGVSFADSGDFSCATSFPEPIGLGATFDRILIRQLATVTSDEARAFSNAGRAGLDFWTPNINIFRDPRWGRGQETPGEDPYLSSEYVYYLIRGYQEGEDSRYYKVVADCKHYAGYDVENWHGNERDGYDAKISMQDLVETYLPSFKSCLKDARVGSAMCSYNAVNGVPACANSFLMNDIARNRWGWDGWITSDCYAVRDILERHHYVSNTSALVQVTLRAGCDIDCDGGLANNGVQAYRDGAIVDADLDLALTRQFSSLIRLGYFDPAANQTYRQYGIERVNTMEAQALARRAALESIVLLKNTAATLPLSASAVKTIALIGPNINNPNGQVGNYNGHTCGMATPFLALSALSSNLTLLQSRGADINSTDTSGFADAVAAAKQADVVIYAGGISEAIEAEAHDRNTIDLPGQQLPLLKQLEAVGKPLVVILFGGGGVDITYLRDSAATHAILWAGYPSQEGGNALAEVLFGRYSPAGRLPVTWYPAEYVDQVPMTDQSMRASATNPGRTYKFYTGTPVYAFGTGMSYTTFSYQVVEEARDVYRIEELVGNARADDRQVDVAMTVNVTNTGAVVSDVVVLAFVSSNATLAGVTPPIRELFDYARVHALGVGQTQTLRFGLSYRVLTHVDERGHAWLLPGRYQLRVQNENEVVREFDLVGQPALVEELPADTNQPSVRTPVVPKSAPLHKHKRGGAS